MGPQPDGPDQQPVSLVKVATATKLDQLDELSLRERSTELARESSRKLIAYMIVGCFVITITFSFVAFWTRGTASVDEVVKLVQAVIAPVVAIVGAVTGFYFSSAANNQKSSNDRGSSPAP
jgi:cytochrome bd-type quinol oxidase subunit 2